MMGTESGGDEGECVCECEGEREWGEREWGEHDDVDEGECGDDEDGDEHDDVVGDEGEGEVQVPFIIRVCKHLHDIRGR